MYLVLSSISGLSQHKQCFHAPFVKNMVSIRGFCRGPSSVLNRVDKNMDSAPMDLMVRELPSEGARQEVSKLCPALLSTCHSHLLPGPEQSAPCLSPCSMQVLKPTLHNIEREFLNISSRACLYPI